MLGLSISSGYPTRLVPSDAYDCCLLHRIKPILAWPQVKNINNEMICLLAGFWRLMIPPKIDRGADLCMERIKILNSNPCHRPSSTCCPGHQPMMELIIDILRVGSENFLGATSIAQGEVARKTFDEGCKGVVMAFFM